MKPVRLTRADWEEIAASLLAKAAGLARGDYGECDQHDGCDCDEKWIAHVRSIYRRIGSDGRRAALRGTITPDFGKEGRP